MQPLQQHIKELSDTFLSKGYDGYFQTNADYPGKLVESLGAFMAAEQKAGEPEAQQLHLYTYTNWKDEDNHTTCFFTVRYQPENGFLVTAMHIERKMHGSKFVAIDINIEKNDQILFCREVNTMAQMPNTKHEKIRSAAKHQVQNPRS